MATNSGILVGKFYRQRILVGSHLWGHKESNMTEHTHTHTIFKVRQEAWWSEISCTSFFMILGGIAFHIDKMI